MNTPLLSVIIPTAGRPDFLPRAVRSALASGPRGEVEVLVVPNGPDESWKGALRTFADEPCVVANPINVAHANVARNHGLLLSRGRYLRFLDDDDYLYPETALRQLATLESSGAEVCSGRVESVGLDLRSHGLTSFPATSDFVCASLSVSGFTLPVGNVFRREALANAAWNPSVPRAQDYVWMLHLAGQRDWHWVHRTETIGAWFHHGGTRVSSKQAPWQRPAWMVEAILDLVRDLADQGRLNDSRRLAAGNALWHTAHQRFPFDPRYSHMLAREALRIHDCSRPPDYPLSGVTMDRLLSPIAFEWALLPKRYLNHLWRTMHSGPDDHVRHI